MCQCGPPAAEYALGFPGFCLFLRGHEICSRATMELRIRFDVFSAALLSALGILKLTACGGSAVDNFSNSGGADQSGGASNPTGGWTSGGSGGAVPKGGTGGTGGSGATGGAQTDCQNERFDPSTMLMRCDGFTHRPQAHTCTSKLPTTTLRPKTSGNDECTTDSECTKKNHGHCEVTQALSFGM